MRSTQDAEHLFKLIREDAQSWLAQARRLRLSAEVIYPEWEKIRSDCQSAPGVRERMLAYSQSFMLLTGFALENLLKGILYGRDSSNKLPTSHKGHGIVEMAKGATTLASTTLTSDELNLLERLEIYLVWAGRYQLPMKPEVFYESQDNVCITTKDPTVIEHLFDKLEGILLKEWEARGNY
jgi:hypothetical protein